MEYLAIIPARGGSKGLPHKNIRPLGGRSLISWTILQAQQTPEISRTIVSTDDQSIRENANAAGAETPFLRPQTLASDTATTESAMLHCLEWLREHENYQPDAVILLQCTSPLRAPGVISKAIQQFEASGADSLLSVSPFSHFLWQRTPDGAAALYDYQNRPRRQDILAADIRYVENGSIYITKTSVLLEQQNRLGGKIEMFEMSELEGLEIDTLLDFQKIELIVNSESIFDPTVLQPN